MRQWISAFAFVAFAGVLAARSAGDDPKPAPTRAEQYAALAKGANDDANEWAKKYREAPEKADKQKALDGYRAAPKAYAAKMFDLAKAKPDDDAACDAAIWLVSRMGQEKVATEAFGILRTHHLANPKMANAVVAINFALVKDGPAFLDEVFVKNPDKKVKAFILRLKASSAMDAVQSYLTPPATLPAKVAEAKGLWERIGKEYGDVVWGRETFEVMAKREVAMLTSFVPGNKAPEIVGEDVDGKPMKLTDFAGKVVMLDFWGTWCGPCMDMVPHNIETAKKFEGKPFAIVGVNSDPKKEVIAKRLSDAKLNIPYRSFWNGDKGSGGPISDEWKVQAWPMVILIDHKGVIRHRFLGSPDTKEEYHALDTAIETLVNEASKKASR